jgi:D-alanyl-D-alanine carboxypeptidase (penicillin-binding protein 5/6)
MKRKFLSILLMFCIVTFTYIGSGSDLKSRADTIASSSTAVSSSSTNAPAITAETAIVADANTGLIYYQKDMHTQMYPASITKILTGLLAVEKGSPQDVITIPDDIDKGMPSNSATIALTGGEQITQEEALYTMFLASANDSANALALHIGGTIANFVDMMNARAKELGAVDSHFDNANGLPDKNNVTSAFDMAIITKAALANTSLMKYFGATSYVLPPTNKRSNSEVFTTLQKMMKDTAYQYDGTIAGKTGWETMSGHTLVTVARRNGRTLICVVMKSSDAYTVYNDTIALLNYVFSQPSSVSTSCYLQAPIPKPVAKVSAPAPTEANIVAAKSEPAESSGSYIAPLLLFACAACFGALLLAVYSRKNKLARRRLRKRSTRA